LTATHALTGVLPLDMLLLRLVNKTAAIPWDAQTWNNLTGRPTSQ